MNLGNYIDIAIILYLLYNLIIGFKNGLVKSLFISLGFIVKAGGTYFIYTSFSKDFMQDNNVLHIINSIKDFLISFMPKLANISKILDIIILILLIYITISIALFILFKIISAITDNDTIKLSDKILGALFLCAKAIIIIMLIVYGFDKVSDYAVPQSVKESLSSSILLPKFYFYNIFMNFFGI